MAENGRQLDSLTAQTTAGNKAWKHPNGPSPKSAGLAPGVKHGDKGLVMVCPLCKSATIRVILWNISKSVDERRAFLAEKSPLFWLLR